MAIRNDPLGLLYTELKIALVDISFIMFVVHAGVEVVQANLDDAPSMAKAVSGCHGVFGVTNFWEHMDKNKEVKQVCKDKRCR